MLEVKDLDCGYGNKQVLYGVHLSVGSNEIVSIIGPNASGKSTILKAIFGILRVWNGTVLFDGRSIVGSSPSQLIQIGITYLPQGHGVFSHLTVNENMNIAGNYLTMRAYRDQLEKVYSFFPAIKDYGNRKAGELSGGEQHMLALARVLTTKPRLMLLDEPCIGLAAGLAHIAFQTITAMSVEFGVSTLIVEHRVKDVLNISERVYAMKLGRVAYEGASSVIKESPEMVRSLFI